ncbi:hypothetical protein EG68_05197, partial [Paragonimus skrjabini miyazakii]
TLLNVVLSSVTHSAREKCVEAWELVTERTRERLRAFYTRLLNHLADNETVYYSSKNVMQHFLDDLDNLDPSSDAAGLELKRAIDRFQDKLQLVERGKQPRGGIVLREQDIVSIHSPLLRFRDHEHQMASLNVQSQFLGKHMASYLHEIDIDRRRVDNELALMSSLQRDHQTQLEHLIGRVRRWSSRYDGRAQLDFSTQESGAESSVRSSTRSDTIWRQASQTGMVQAIRPNVEYAQSQATGSLPVVDAITQIGIQTVNTASQVSPNQWELSSRDYKSRDMKEALCQIGLVTTTASCQTDMPRSEPNVRPVLYEAITQTGTVSSPVGVQANLIGEDVVRAQQVQGQSAIPGSGSGTEVIDAVCQIGLVQATVHTQTEKWSGLNTVGLQTDSKISSFGRETNDAICQIGLVTNSVGLQATTARSQNAETQADLISDVLLQVEHLQKMQRQIPEPKLEAVCQVGVVQQSIGLQADLVKPRAQVTDVVCQVGLIRNSASTQVDSSAQNQMNVSTQLGVVTVNKELQTEHQEDTILVESRQGNTQAAPPKMTTSVETQIGTVSRTQGMQCDGLIRKEASRVSVTMQTSYQTNERSTQSDTIPYAGHPVRNRYDVEAQTGIVNTPQGTQTVSESTEKYIGSGTPAVYSMIMKGVDYKVETSMPKSEVACGADLRETPTRQHVPAMDVELQVGNIFQHKSADTFELQPQMCEYALQTPNSPEISTKRSKSYDVLTQVGVAKESHGTQFTNSQPTLTKSQLFDVELQSGVVSTSRAMQTTDAYSKPKAIDSTHGTEQEVQMSALTMQSEPRSKPTYHVETQSGVVSQTAATQTSEKKAPNDAQVQVSLETNGIDHKIQAADELKVEALPPLQNLPPPPQKDNVGIQAELKSTRFDVELQSGVVSQVHATQTKEITQQKPHVDDSQIQTTLGPIPIDW